MTHDTNLYCHFKLNFSSLYLLIHTFTCYEQNFSDKIPEYKRLCTQRKRLCLMGMITQFDSLHNQWGNNVHGHLKNNIKTLTFGLFSLSESHST